MYVLLHIDGLMQERRNSMANALDVFLVVSVSTDIQALNP